jgi:hypothetical protein
MEMHNWHSSQKEYDDKTKDIKKGAASIMQGKIKNKQHGKPWSRLQAFIDMGLEARGWGSSDWDNLYQKRRGNWPLLNKIMNLHFQ